MEKGKIPPMLVTHTELSQNLLRSNIQDFASLCFLQVFGILAFRQQESLVDPENLEYKQI